MPSRFDDLKRLQQMLNDELVTREEFSTLKDELLLEAPESAETIEESPHAPDPAADQDMPASQDLSVATMSQLLAMSRLSGDDLYKVAFGLGIASLFLGIVFGLLAWATVAVSGWALYSTKVVKGRWMAWTGLGLGLVYSLANAYRNGHLDGLF
jgi:hypothetical protein